MLQTLANLAVVALFAVPVLWVLAIVESAFEDELRKESK
jgi:hypothetical protein